MSSSYIYDNLSNTRGQIRNDGGGNQSAYDASGSYLGCYNASNNTTYDSSNSPIGQGNLLGALVGR